MRANKDIKVAFLGHVAPFMPEFYEMPGYGRPGSFAQLGIIEALYNSGLGLDVAWGFRPISHWPKARVLVEGRRRCVLDCGAKLVLLPLINLHLIREFSRYVIIAWILMAWSFRRIGYKRVLVIYNLTHPNGLVWLRLMTWLARIKLVPVVYDLARISAYKKSFAFRVLEPDWLDRLHEHMMPLCDGLMPITDAIAHDFAPGLQYFRLDGGVGEAVLKRLAISIKRNKAENCKNRPSGEFRLAYAGSLDPWNNITLLLEYMKANNDPSLRLLLAGSGLQEGEVRDAASKDTRIQFMGYLGSDALMDFYLNADVLVSLRDLHTSGLKYHYPSKTFEMMAAGKPIILTNTSHTKNAYGKYCKVIDNCDMESFSSAVDYFRCMTSEERISYGQAARAFVLEKRRWAKLGEPIGNYIRMIMS